MTTHAHHDPGYEPPAGPADDAAAGHDEAAVLRKAMAATVRSHRAELCLRWSSAIEAALQAVPRHLFIPEAGLEAAYAIDAVVTKRDATGRSISAVSSPSIIATMLHQLDPQPGDQILEIGSGGYNAALLAELVGPTGHVTSLDIDPDVTDRARRCLDAAGYTSVDVVTGDAEHGLPQQAPYDRIIVTAGAWDLPPAWLWQLTPTGRLVVPLRLHSLTRSIAFHPQGNGWIGTDVQLCGFVPIQGSGAHTEHTISLGDQASLRIDDPQPAHTHLPTDVLHQPGTEVWTGVQLPPDECSDRLDLWLASHLDGYCWLTPTDTAIQTGQITPCLPWGTSAIISDTSLAYLTLSLTSPCATPPPPTRTPKAGIASSVSAPTAPTPNPSHTASPTTSTPGTNTPATPPSPTSRQHPRHPTGRISATT